MKILLRLKHWQMFLLLFLPLAFQSNSTPGQFMGMLWSVMWIAWIYSIGVTAYNKLPEGHGISKTFFEVSGILTVAYLVIITIIFDGRGYNINQDNYKEYGPYWYLLVLGTMYLMFSLLYMFYFAARMLRSTVEGKIVGFNSSFGYFFGFWFFPIGVWFIQPNAQKLI